MTPQEIADAKKKLLATKPAGRDISALKAELLKQKPANVQQPGLIEQTGRNITGLSGLQALTRTAQAVPNIAYQRGGEIVNSIKSAASGEISPPSAALRVANAAVAVPFDIAGTGVKELAQAIAPKTSNFVSNIFGKIKSGLEKISSSGPVAKLADKYVAFEQAHPEAATNIGAGLNLALNLSAGLEAPEAKSLSTNALKNVESKVTESVIGTEQKIQTGLQTGKTAKIENQYRSIAGEGSKSFKTLSRAESVGKDPIKFLSERGITPAVEGGRISRESVAETVQGMHEATKPMNEVLNKGLDAIQPSIPLTPIASLEQRAIQLARTPGNIAKNIADDLETAIRSEFETYRKNLGDSLTLRKVNEIKQAKWSQLTSRFDLVKPLQGDVNYLIGKAGQDIVEQSVPQSAFGVHELNAYIGQSMEAAKFLNTLAGKAVRGGRFSNYFNKLTGAFIGSAIGGGLGSIIGSLGAEGLTTMLQKAALGDPIADLFIKSIEKTNPAAYQRALDFLDKSAKEAAGRKLLPPSKTIFSNPPVPVPQESRLLTQPEAVQKLTEINKPTEASTIVSAGNNANKLRAGNFPMEAGVSVIKNGKGQYFLKKPGRLSTRISEQEAMQLDQAGYPISQTP